MSALLLKVVSCDYIRARQTTAIVFNNDGKAFCHDWVIPSLGLIATDRFGILPSETTCMLAIIFAMHNLLILGVLQGAKWSSSLHMDVC